MSRSPLEKCWDVYRETQIPPGMGDEGIAAMRECFFSGAASMHAVSKAYGAEDMKGAFSEGIGIGRLRHASHWGDTKSLADDLWLESSTLQSIVHNGQT